MPHPSIVHGRMLHAQGGSAAEIAVHLLERDLPSLERREGREPQELGRAVTDAEGRFEITYSFETAQHGEARPPLTGEPREPGPDLSFRLFDPHGRALGIKRLTANDREVADPQIVFNAPADLRVEILIDPAGEAPPSEYEELLFRLSPALEDVPVGALTDEDVGFLAGETGFDGEILDFLRVSAQLTAETGIAQEAFYGLARVKLPLNLDELSRLALEAPDTLRRALQKATDPAFTGTGRNIIPATFRSRIDEIIRHLELRKHEPRRVTVQLLDQGGRPLEQVKVRMLDLGVGSEPVELSAGVSDGNGRLEVRFTATPSAEERRLRLEVAVPGVAEPHTVDVSVGRDPAALEVRVPVPHREAPRLAAVPVDVPPVLATFLEGRQIRTLADVRRAGGLGRLDGLPLPADHPAVRTLEAHADLARVSSDMQANQVLIDNGFTSVAAIGAAGRQEFLTAAGERLGVANAIRMRENAAAQTQFFDHLIGGALTERANGVAVPDSLRALDALLPKKCGCEDCDAAVSPRAYLADLLRYTIQHIRNNGAPVDLAFFSSTFHQPFGDLPASCGAAEKLVRQVRVCVEALRRDVGPRPLGDATEERALTEAERAYRFAAYTHLLSEMGTSYEEIRLARTAEDDERLALAERLGIQLTRPRATAGDELDRLFLDPDAAAGARDELTEEALELLFGLVDTRQDPLLEAVKVGDAGGQIRRWMLQGVRWQLTTDRDGVIHGSISRQAGRVRIELHKGRARSDDQRVATGEAADGAGSVTVAAEKGSGLTGVFEVASSGAPASEFAIAAVPSVLAWRLGYLRAQWESQDHVNDPYVADADNPLPVIDPDLIGPDDFRRPVVGNRAFDLWQARRRFVDQTLAAIRAEHESAGVDAMLTLILGVARPALDALKKDLEDDPEKRAKATRTITETHHLTVESLIRLLAILDLPTPTEDERAEIYSILTQARKLREYPAWIAQERPAGPAPRIVLGPEDFWIALSEPTALPKWRATAEARQAWQRVLRERSGLPIIDPDLIGATNLADPLEGPASTLWQQRHDEVQRQFVALKTERESHTAAIDGFDAIIVRGLGTTTSDLVDLETKRRAGESIQPRLAQLTLTAAALDYLLSIRELARQPQPEIAEAEWNEVYSILTEVSKERRFGLWHEEERAAGITLSPDHFALPAPAVTPPPADSSLRWRVSAIARRNWLDRLQSRIDQEQGVIDSMAQAVGSAEEATLPGLRDALILATSGEGVTLEEKAVSTTQRLILDARMSALHKTTRVALALETLQGLLFALRTGQARAHPTLSLAADDFDEEWKWIGSYATWRGAMFVFLYPENLLLPTLRKYQTPAFLRLVERLRSSRRLTPEEACQAAEEYASYFRDVCSLRVQATCQIKTPIGAGDHCAPVPQQEHELLFMFGLASSGQVYWSTWDPQASPDWAQRFWRKVDPLAAVSVSRIVGAVALDSAQTLDRVDLGVEVGIPRAIPVDDVVDTTRRVRRIYLFVLGTQNGKKGLLCTTYEAGENPGWNGGPNAFENLPRNISALDVFTVQSEDLYRLPSLVLHVPGEQYLYHRTVNVEGKDWVTAGDWESESKIRITNEEKGTTDGEVVRLHAVVQTQDVRWYFFLNRPAMGFAPPVPPKIKFWTQPGTADTLLHGEWIGVLAWNGLEPLPVGGHRRRVDDAFIFYRDGRGIPWHKHIISTGFPDDLGAAFTGLQRIASWSGSASDPHRAFVYWTGRGQYVCPTVLSNGRLTFPLMARVVPNHTSPLDISARLTTAQLQIRRQHIQNAYKSLDDGSPSVLTYLDEAYYFVPLYIAQQLQRSGQYTVALDWYRTVYDYAAPAGQWKIFFGLEQEAGLSSAFQRASDWLSDPLNPHAIARTRRNAYTRFTLMTLARCFLEFGDAEFTYDTPESLALARTLYETALALLGGDELTQGVDGCEALIGELSIALAEPAAHAALERALPGLGSVKDFSVLSEAARQVRTALQATVPLRERVSRVRDIVASARATALDAETLREAIIARAAAGAASHAALAVDPAIERASERIGLLAGAAIGENGQTAGPAVPPGSTAASGWMAAPLGFCIPPNPLPQSLRLHAEVNLRKLRSCRNIAGMQRQLDAYAAPTDTSTGLPTVGAAGQLTVPGANVIRPTLHRYSALIERAKQLTQLAAQMEAAMLATLEKKAQAAYNLLKARQDLGLARANVRLQGLRLTEANDGVKLAELQQARAEIARRTYDEWIQTGEIDYEREVKQAYAEAAAAQKGAAEAGHRLQQKGAVLSSLQLGGQAASGGGPAGIAAGLAVFAANLNVDMYLLSELNEDTKKAIDATLKAQIASLNAAFERRKQEWQLQRALAEQDRAIGGQQVTLANDRVRIVEQEQTIAGIQETHANDVIHFLHNQFPSEELYDWMSRILEGVYGFFLQQATAMAKLAENQLAFERQKAPAGYIQADYWLPPTEGEPAEGRGPDRKGLTGSARLLRDIYELDQYAFAKNQRKLQLTKTLSLARMFPAEFQRFRQTGVLPFATVMELFDRDFPGQYLRLIKRVRTSVIALVPPTDGIHATLSSSGISRVMVGPETFQTVVIRRDPEMVALTAPLNSTGLFELEAQGEMLLPFEGNGVDMSWEFRMPRAANLFDYRTVADVLITLEYTALHSEVYRQQVIERLGSRINADRSFSFRNQFADQWYDLHNPENPNAPLRVSFEVAAEDFPPNVHAVSIDRILLYFSRAEERAASLGWKDADLRTRLSFTPKGNDGGLPVSGTATPVDGIISTRRASGSSWLQMTGRSPVGTWTLELPQEAHRCFQQEAVEDMLFVIGYRARTAEWPA
jgi:Tc toxin complex TcA C-terminal TcB-binding domain